jgi:predicted transcriptional regulator
MVICVLRMELERQLEPQLAPLARQQGKTRSACIREAIQQDLLRHGDSEQACRQPEHLAQLEQPNGSEPPPDWRGWTA